MNPFQRTNDRTILSILCTILVLALLLPGMASAAVTPKVAAGDFHTMALKNDGTVWACGENSSGQIGDNSTTDRLTPVRVNGLINVTAITAGSEHSLALKSDGTVWAWGNNGSGQLGDNDKTRRLTPVQVSGLTNVTAIAAGYHHSVALKNDGTVWAWGNNGHGQIGDNSTTQRLTPVLVSGLTNVTAIIAGSEHSLALKSDGTIWAWGRNDSGQLGNDGTTGLLSPVQVSGLANVTAIAAGYYHSVALKNDGTVWAWGNNGHGQLGDNSTTQRLTPVLVSGLSNATAITAWAGHTIALKDDGTVWAWGYNVAGQLGDRNTSQHLTPVQVSDITNVTAIGTGYYHTLALKDDGSLWAWGDNAAGQLGNNGITNRPSPVQVSGLANVAAITAGESYTVALKNDGTVWAWGKNSVGQLGDNSTTKRLTPVQVNDLTNVTAITASNDGHTIALKNDGTVWAWGRNGMTLSLIPIQVSGLANVTAIAAGSGHTIALKNDGTVWAWGNSITPSLTPVQVSGLANITAIAAGNYHSVALKNDGTVWTWGGNGEGQLGDDSTTQRLTPVLVSGLANINVITAGTIHSVALKNDGTVWAWGDNLYGQLGDDSTTDRLTPVQANGLVNVIAIAAGYGHTIALKDDGTVWAWGNNGSGQLGDNSTDSSIQYKRSPGPALINLDATSPVITIDKASGIYVGTLQINVSCSDEFSGCDKIYYAVGSTPTADSPVYSGPITIPDGSEDLKFMAIDRAGNRSEVITRSYIVNPSAYPLTITFAGAGKGSITISSGGSCASTSAGCSQSVAVGAGVALKPTAPLGSYFSGWTGCDSIIGTTCSLSMNNSKSVTATFETDTNKPVVGTFSIPATSASLTFDVTSFDATDGSGSGVAGFLITETSSVPSTALATWKPSPPTSYTALKAGANRLIYAWAKDRAGNVSLAKTATITIDTPPLISVFTAPAYTKTAAIAVKITVSDNVGVTGYQITENVTVPTTWLTTAPTTYAIGSEGNKTLYAWAKDVSGNTAYKSATAFYDKTAPSVDTFTMDTNVPAAIPIKAFEASDTDGSGIAGYLITATATAPLATATTWSATVPTTFTNTVSGQKTIYAWVKDKAGNVSAAKTATVTADVVLPVVTTFTLNATVVKDFKVSITALTATDLSGIGGYLVTETATTPALSDAGWNGTPPTDYTFTSAGAKKLYGWAKDAVGNISKAKIVSVTIDQIAPLVSTLTVPVACNNLIMPITAFKGTDNVAVTGYLITESATAPDPGATTWTATAPKSYTYNSAGKKTIYAWVKDSMGYVSAAKSADVQIDIIKPRVDSFTADATVKGLVVQVTAFTGTDETDGSGIVGYKITETSTAPLATATGWTATAPTSYTTKTTVAKTLYAWTKDRAGNVSAAKTASVTFTP